MKLRTWKRGTEIGAMIALSLMFAILVIQLNKALSIPEVKTKVIEYRLDPCLTWNEYKAKYPTIKSEHLVSAMLVQCPQ